jgi:hypothetical protein
MSSLNRFRINSAIVIGHLLPNYAVSVLDISNGTSSLYRIMGQAKEHGAIGLAF